MKNTKVSDSQLYNLPKVHNRAGNLTSVHSNNEVPFPIKRVFYIFDIPSGQTRGGHAHKECHEFIVPVCGSFEVIIDDGESKKTFYLNNPTQALHLIPGTWINLFNFSSGAVVLVFNSLQYDEKDYIREYAEFINYKKQ